MAGPTQPPFVHALANALNAFLGNVGPAVTYSSEVSFWPERAGTLKDLADDMAAGRVEVLLILGGNPVYHAPADLAFGDKMASVPFRVHQALYDNETSALCHWHLPEAHYLEAWGDLRRPRRDSGHHPAVDCALYAGTTAQELMALVNEQLERSSHEIVRGYYRGLFENRAPGSVAGRRYWEQQGLLGAFTGDFEAWWEPTVRLCWPSEKRGRCSDTTPTFGVPWARRLPFSSMVTVPPLGRNGPAVTVTVAVALLVAVVNCRG